MASSGRHTVVPHGPAHARPAALAHPDRGAHPACAARPRPGPPRRGPGVPRGRPLRRRARPRHPLPRRRAPARPRAVAAPDGLTSRVAQQPQTPEQALAWEAERRPRAVFAAATGAMLVLGGGIFSAVESSRDFPTVGIVQAISPALHGQAAAQTDPHVAAAHFYDERASKLAAAAAVAALGTLLMAYVLVYLARAVRARRPEFPPAFIWLPVIGAVGGTIGSIGLQLTYGSNARDYLAGPRTADALDKIHTGGTGIAVFSAFSYIGLALAFGLVVISLNAMRVGLLTRFMGVLGIIVGVLFVIPLGTLPVVQAFWLGAVGVLVAMRWPSGQPPAWITGTAQPWPSTQDVRRQHEAERNRAEAQAIKEAPADSELAEPVRPAHSSSKKRRKKRRH